MSGQPRQAFEELRAFALSLPGAYEDYPWGESVIKVNKKIFVFFGLMDNLDARLFLGVKLPRTGEYALDLAYVKPSGYNLGKHGWVNVQPPEDEPYTMDLFIEWIEESYRAVAPKKLIAALEAQRQT